MRAQWGNECISLSVLSMARVMIAQMHKNHSGLLVVAHTTAVSPLRLGYNFRQVNNWANQFGHALHTLGLTSNRKLAILMKNSPEMLFAFYGQCSNFMSP